MTMAFSSFGDPDYADLNMNSLDYPDRRHSLYGDTSLPSSIKEPIKSDLLSFYKFTLLYENSKFYGTVTAYSKEHALRAVQNVIMDKAKISYVPEEIIINVTKHNVEYYVYHNSLIIFDGDT